MSNKFQIIWIDDLTVRRTNLEVGENVIGNFTNTDGESESVIKQAAIINLSPDNEITITPCEGISCFIKNNGTLRWKSIRSNWQVPLKVRDTCLLFPVRIWLRLLPAMDDSNGITSPKRKLEEIEGDEPVEKRCRSESDIEFIEPVKPILCNNNHEPINEQNFLEARDENEDINEEINEVNQDLADALCIESSSFNFNQDNNEVQENTNSTNTIDNTDSDITNNQTSTPNSSNNQREKCKYGDKCYRINSEHKTKFSHPGDPDYNLPDNRPECPYGIKCYRKNPQHKLDYKHTNDKKKRVLNPSRAQSSMHWSDFDSDESMDESVDESEYDPSFIDDESEIEEFESDFEDEE